ncbi:MAG: GIY-YIG nuclease family protein [candidate division Zixibacteria bacterium]|nr:GIY-YIG nuclease family protein [candidate division Zixibacteria bacterium]
MNNKCCEGLFDDFKSPEDIKTVTPPKKKGVYVISVKATGKTPSEIIKQVEPLISQLNWSTVGDYMRERICRLKKVSECPTIYIGKADDLRRRYDDFRGCHTAMYPIWALLFFGWELEYGWVLDESPGKREEELKNQYRNKHSDNLPALVEE